jgi:diguanylate cyclase (GGDEF)-like protein
MDGGCVGFRRFRRHLPAIALATLALAAGDVRAQLRAGENAETTLAQVDATKTSDHPAFVAALDRLGKARDQMPPDARAHLDYLVAWQVVYAGDYAKGLPLLEAIADHSTSRTLRMRASATLVNILGMGHRYEEAFVRLNGMVASLPTVSDPVARMQALIEASQLLTSAGQYDQAMNYAEQAIAESTTRANACKTNMVKLHAMYRAGHVDGNDARFSQWVGECQASGEALYANALRADVADSAITRGHPADAISLLQRYYDSVLHDDYPTQTAQVDATLARAALAVGDLDMAQGYALSAVKTAVPGEYSEPLVSATRTAYLIAKKRGDWKSATAWLERSTEADKGYLDDVTARSIAYQIVKQQVTASRLEADALDKQNQILHLQREADQNDAASTRLYFLLLAATTAAIVLWLMRTRRSQRRFMQMARTDGLTGTSNRQAFVDECGSALADARRSGEKISLVLFDLDHFKQINDTHGHAEGDWVLLRVVAECRDHLRDHDVFGRLGGEEFAVMLRDTTPAQAREIAERMRVAISAPSDEHLTILRATASFGVASTVMFGYELDRLLMKADEAMYQAKNTGRDRVVIAT